jgi:hypothetical protein
MMIAGDGKQQPFNRNASALYYDVAFCDQLWRKRKE